jgi:hypothetical protein
LPDIVGFLKSGAGVDVDADDGLEGLEGQLVLLGVVVPVRADEFAGVGVELVGVVVADRAAEGTAAVDGVVAVVVTVVVNELELVEAVVGEVPPCGDEVAALVVPDGEGRGQQQGRLGGVGGEGVAATDAVDARRRYRTAAAGNRL